MYGDTDSIFVNSNVTELAEALKISAMLKKAVNDRYKLLEIDLDAVFHISAARRKAPRRNSLPMDRGDGSSTAGRTFPTAGIGTELLADREKIGVTRCGSPF